MIDLCSITKYTWMSILKICRTIGRVFHFKRNVFFPYVSSAYATLCCQEGVRPLDVLQQNNVVSHASIARFTILFLFIIALVVVASCVVYYPLIAKHLKPKCCLSNPILIHIIPNLPFQTLTWQYLLTHAMKCNLHTVRSRLHRFCLQGERNLPGLFLDVSLMAIY